MVSARASEQLAVPGQVRCGRKSNEITAIPELLKILNLAGCLVTIDATGMKNYQFDAVIIGAGPNGLTAGICLAQKGLSVLIVEAKSTIGGGSRSAELTLPGFVHDICSTIHPLAAGSPVFHKFPLEKYGLEFIQPPVNLAHPLDDGTAVLLKNSFSETGETLGKDAENYRQLIEPFAKSWESLAPGILAPLRFPKHPFLMADFGFKAFRSARSFVNKYFRDKPARAVFGGLAAHSMLPLEDLPSAAFGLVLAITAHAVGWKFPRGGSQNITGALENYFLSLDGKIETGHIVERIEELPSSRIVLFDLSPRQILKIAGHLFPSSYRQRLDGFKYGAGVFKLDYALSEPIPWKATECALSATVHLSGAFDETAQSERSFESGKVSDKPFVLLAQTSLFDQTRAPQGKHTAWAYCHIPNNSPIDMTEKIENQIERFAPGFRDCILAKHTMSAPELEKYNNNYIGGDIGGGANIVSQLFTRPTFQLNPYKLPAKGLYICSASTPPGGGVHGMCGYHAAKTVLEKEFNIKS